MTPADAMAWMNDISRLAEEKEKENTVLDLMQLMTGDNSTKLDILDKNRIAMYSYQYSQYHILHS